MFTYFKVIFSLITIAVLVLSLFCVVLTISKNTVKLNVFFLLSMILAVRYSKIIFSFTVELVLRCFDDLEKYS